MDYHRSPAPVYRVNCNARLVWYRRGKYQEKRPVDTVTDTLLIQQAARGDAQAFGHLYDMYVDRIYRHIYYKIGNVTDTEDLTQEVFFRAWKSIGKYKQGSTPFIAWLMTISHNLVVDFYRRKKDNTSIDDELAIIDPRPNPEEAAELEFDQQQLRKAILKLPDTQQQVIVMRFIEGFEYSEIATALQKSEGAIRVIQHRALAKLQTIIKEKE